MRWPSMRNRGSVSLCMPKSPRREDLSGLYWPGCMKEELSKWRILVQQMDHCTFQPRQEAFFWLRPIFQTVEADAVDLYSCSELQRYFFIESKNQRSTCGSLSFSFIAVFLNLSLENILIKNTCFDLYFVSATCCKLARTKMFRNWSTSACYSK